MDQPTFPYRRAGAHSQDRRPAAAARQAELARSGRTNRSNRLNRSSGAGRRGNAQVRTACCAYDGYPRARAHASALPRQSSSPCSQSVRMPWQRRGLARIPNRERRPLPQPSASISWLSVQALTAGHPFCRDRRDARRLSARRPLDDIHEFRDLAALLRFVPGGYGMLHTMADVVT